MMKQIWDRKEDIMIKLLRIDDRLIHGQVAVYMVKATSADTIVVASDQHANNAILKMSLNVGKPAGCKMEIMTIVNTISYLNDSTNDKKNILVVTGSCDSALNLCQNCKGIEKVNLGGQRYAENKTSITNQIFIDENDLNDLMQIAELGIDVYAQDTPSKEKISVKGIKAKFN